MKHVLADKIGSEYLRLSLLAHSPVINMASWEIPEKNRSFLAVKIMESNLIESWIFDACDAMLAYERVYHGYFP